MPYKDSRNPKLLAYKKAYYLKIKGTERQKEWNRRGQAKYRKKNRLRLNKYKRDRYRPEHNKKLRQPHQYKYNAKAKERIQNLSQDYIIHLLTSEGWTKEQIKQHPELIDIKRLTIKTKRLCNQKTLKTSETV